MRKYVIAILFLIIAISGCSKRNLFKDHLEINGFTCYDDVCINVIEDDQYQNEDIFFHEEMKETFELDTNNFIMHYSRFVFGSTTVKEQYVLTATYNYADNITVISIINGSYKYVYSEKNNELVISSVGTFNTHKDVYSCNYNELYVINICNDLKDKIQTAKGKFKVYQGELSIEDIITKRK